MPMKGTGKEGGLVRKDLRLQQHYSGKVLISLLWVIDSTQPVKGVS